MAPKLLLVGTGVRGLSQMTVETVSALRGLDVLFSLHGGKDVTRALKGLSRDVRDLTTLYKDKALDLKVYEAIVSRVKGALRGDRTVGVVFHGHPLLYSNPAQMLIAHCESAGVELEVMSGVSSMDGIFTALKTDVGATGLQVFDVNRLLLYRLRPATHTPCLLFQIGSFGSALITRKLDNAVGRFKPLERYLRRVYPAGHPAFVVECASEPGRADSVLKTTVDGLDKVAARINYNSTLYIPAGTRPPRPDPRFLKTLRDPSKVARITRAR